MIVFFPPFSPVETQKRAPSSIRATQCVSHIATVIHHAGPFAKSFELPPSWEITARAGVRGLCAFCFWQNTSLVFFFYDLLHIIEGRPDYVVSARLFPRRYQTKKRHTHFVQTLMEDKQLT